MEVKDEEFKQLADDTVDKISKIVNIPTGMGLRLAVYDVVLEAIKEANNPKWKWLD